jgi:hypothetical protein
MGPALVGLLGVVVGVLLSGTATFVIARRSERRQACAAARLLEAELRVVAGRLDLLNYEPDASSAVSGPQPRYEDVRAILGIPRPRLWDEHKAVLATALNADDWYAIAGAYESIDILRGAASMKKMWFGGEDDRVTIPQVGDVLVDLARNVRLGIAAVSAVAGTRNPDQRGDPFREHLIGLMREQATELGDDPRFAPPAESPGDSAPPDDARAGS